MIDTSLFATNISTFNAQEFLALKSVLERQHSFEEGERSRKRWEAIVQLIQIIRFSKMATIRTIYINMRSIEVNCIHIYLDLSISLLPLGNRTPFLIPLCNFLLSLMSSDNPKDPFTVWMLFDFTPSTLHIYILKHNKTSVVQPRGKLPGCQKHDGPLHRWSLAFGIIFFSCYLSGSKQT